MKSMQKTILVIEDEELVRDLLEELLSLEGYQVKLNENGNKGLDFFKSNADAIDLVILDLNLGDVSGYYIYKEMVKFKPSVKVIISSGDSHSDELIRLSQTQNLSILNKPFENANLLSQIEQLLTN